MDYMVTLLKGLHWSVEGSKLYIENRIEPCALQFFRFNALTLQRFNHVTIVTLAKYGFPHSPRSRRRGAGFSLADEAGGRAVGKKLELGA